MFENKTKYILIFIILLIMSSCTRQTEISSPTITTSYILLNPTKTLSIIPKITSTMTYTSIPSTTPIPKQMTITALITTQEQTSTKTITPFPTLSEIQSKDYFFQLMMDNSGCKLPCWWGIVPGATSWDGVQTMIKKMGKTITDWTLQNGIVHHDIGIEIHNPFIQNLIGFYQINGIVQAIDIHAMAYQDKDYFRNLWKNYSPDQIMRIYGPPTTIDVDVGIGKGEVGGPGSNIVFTYDDEFMVIYSTKPVEIIDNGKLMYRICPSWQDIVWDPELSIFLKSADYSMSIDQYVSLVSSIDLKTSKSISDASGLSIEDFYNRFLPGNGPACFDTPQNIWK